MEAKEIRLRSGMLTDREAAKAIGLPMWRVRRAVSLGVIQSYNQLGNGTLVVHETDLWTLTNQVDVPEVRGDWFDDTRNLDVRYFGQRVESLKSTPIGTFQSQFARTGLTVGESVLRHEAHSFARYQLRNGNQRYGFKPGSKGLESLYAIGPDKWRHFSKDCVGKLQRASFVLHGKRQALSTACRSGFATLCQQAVRRAF